MLSMDWSRTLEAVMGNHGRVNEAWLWISSCGFGVLYRIEREWMWWNETFSSFVPGATSLIWETANKHEKKRKNIMKLQNLLQPWSHSYFSTDFQIFRKTLLIECCIRTSVIWKNLIHSTQTKHFPLDNFICLAARVQEFISSQYHLITLYQWTGVV